MIRRFTSSTQMPSFHSHPVSRRLIYHCIAPMLALIGTCFVLGGILARFEMDLEIKNNDQALKDTYILRDSGMCPVDPMLALLGSNASVPLSLSFNWMTCDKPFHLDGGVTYGDVLDFYFEQDELNLNRKNNHDLQVFRYLLSFHLDVEFKTELVGQADTDKTAMRAVIPSATGGARCRVHWACGALFWFTIMTTIGYGNAVPVTTLSWWLLVIPFGLATIILCSILCHKAAQSWKVMLEECFLRRKWVWLVSGPCSVLLWLFVFSTWCLLFTIGVRIFVSRTGGAIPLGQAYWFAFITLTTVGFGDHHFAHEEIAVGDMFVIPWMCLTGFNILDILVQKVATLLLDGESNDWIEFFEALRGGRYSWQQRDQ